MFTEELGIIFQKWVTRPAWRLCFQSIPNNPTIKTNEPRKSRQIVFLVVIKFEFANNTGDATKKSVAYKRHRRWKLLEIYHIRIEISTGEKIKRNSSKTKRI